MTILNKTLTTFVALLATGLVAAGAASAPQEDAEAIAESVLKAGADLFNAKDAAALAATYTEDGHVHLIGKREGRIHDEARRGRAEIEKLYQEAFEKVESIDVQNTVESARLVGSDILIINGRFRTEAGKGEFPFVQLRTKQGEDWLLKELWLFLVPEES